MARAQHRWLRATARQRQPADQNLAARWPTSRCAGFLVALPPLARHFRPPVEPPHRSRLCDRPSLTRPCSLTLRLSHADSVRFMVDDMVRIAGGVFVMGSDEFYPDERPVHERV